MLINYSRNKSPWKKSSEKILLEVSKESPPPCKGFGLELCPLRKEVHRERHLGSGIGSLGVVRYEM